MKRLLLTAVSALSLIATAAEAAYVFDAPGLYSWTAPTTGTYAKMLLIQAPSATQGNVSKINGNNGAKFDGAIYFPKGTLNFLGSSSASTKCAMIVAFHVDFGGNTDIQNNTTGCTANSSVPGKIVRLVA